MRINVKKWEKMALVLATNFWSLYGKWNESIPSFLVYAAA